MASSPTQTEPAQPRMVRRWGIQTQLTLGMGVSVTLIAALAVLAVPAAWQRAETLRHIQYTHQPMVDAALEARASMNSARRYEKDFILAWRELGYNEARTRYLSLVRTRIGKIVANMKEIRRLAMESHDQQFKQQVIQGANEIDQQARRYENSFIELVELHGRVGFMDTGIEGRIRERAHAMEKIIVPSSPQLMVDLLQLRRREKDYLLRGKEWDIAAVRQHEEYFGQRIRQMPGLSTAQRDTLSAQFTAYAALFDEYAEVRAKIAATRQQVNSVSNNLEMLMGTLHQNADAARDDEFEHALSNTKQDLMVFALGCTAALLLMLLTAWVVRRGILRSAAKIEESEQRFRTVTESANDAIISVGEAGNIVGWNTAAERLFGYTQAEMLGQPLTRLIPERFRELHRAEMARVIAGDAAHVIGKTTVELAGLHKNGSELPLEISLSQWRVAGSQFFTAIIRDISERKRVANEIRKLNEELELKVQERTQQLLDAQEELVLKEKLSVLGQVAGSVGHELRNPLGVMSNAVYFLQTVLSDADETTREYLGIIKNEIAASERIVSDLLDSVRTKPPHPEMVGLAELIGQTLRKLTIPPSVSVKLDLPETLPLLRVDALQIHQVLRNLISNGVEAMPEGGTLEIRALENQPDGTVAVKVQDSGTGIAPEVLAKLFTPLLTTKARGIGLGLVVVKNLTQANGGTVQVTSEVGKGTTFTVTLPAVVQP